METLVIADIAGEMDAFERLIKRVPAKCEILGVGDLVDRGPKSKEVIEWFMQNHKRANSIMGNHEHMMIDYINKTGIYGHGVWHMNGGMKTMWSYDDEVPPAHIEWLATRPVYKMLKGDCLVTHAPLNKRFTLAEAISKTGLGIDDPCFEISLLWSREEPIERDFFQVFGHNSHWGLRSFEKWALCIDQSRYQVLTGFHWPSMEIFEEPYENARATPEVTL